MPITRFTPLNDPILDPRNEEDLVLRALDRVHAISNGRLNDFSPSSPARALIEGQAFCGAELLYWVNKLPEALAIAFLKIAGIQQRLGSAAQATLTFTLTAPLSSPFVIPQGYQVKSDSGNLVFATDTVLIIPAGSISGQVSATCTETGTKGNVGAYTLRQLTQPLAFLGGVVNTAPAAGGTDGETLDETKARAFASLRRRGLISADDYEQETRALLGMGSVAHCIGNLAADKISFQRGIVHVFCLNPDGSLLNEAQLNDTKAALQKKTPIAVTVYASNVDVVDLDLFAICAMFPGTNPQTIATDTWNALREYLKPGRLPLGETILLKEIEFLIRGVGVSYVQSVSIGKHLEPRLSTNFALPHPYSAARIKSLGIDLVDGATTYSFAFGEGDPD